MSNTLHAVLNKELKGVAILVHIEIACINLGNNVLDVEGSIELWRLFQFKDDFLKMVVRRKDRDNADGDSKLFNT